MNSAHTRPTRPHPLAIAIGIGLGTAIGFLCFSAGQFIQHSLGTWLQIVGVASAVLAAIGTVSAAWIARDAARSSADASRRSADATERLFLLEDRKFRLACSSVECLHPVTVRRHIYGFDEPGIEFSLIGPVDGVNFNSHWWISLNPQFHPVGLPGSVFSSELPKVPCGEKIWLSLREAFRRGEEQLLKLRNQSVEPGDMFVCLVKLVFYLVERIDNQGTDIFVVFRREADGYWMAREVSVGHLPAVFGDPTGDEFHRLAQENSFANFCPSTWPDESFLEAVSLVEQAKSRRPKGLKNFIFIFKDLLNRIR